MDDFEPKTGSTLAPSAGEWAPVTEWEFMRYFLGIDGGGTKTAALIVDESGVELGSGEGGPGNIANNEDRTLRKSLHAAVGAAREDAGLPESTRFASVCAAVAGYSAPQRLEAFEALLKTEILADHYSVVPDYIAAYWGATHGEPGVVVIAGTGAVAYGRNAEGQDRDSVLASFVSKVVAILEQVTKRGG